MIINPRHVVRAILLFFLFLAQPGFAEHAWDENGFYITSAGPAGAVTAVYDGAYKISPGSIDISLNNMFLIQRGWKDPFRILEVTARLASVDKTVADSKPHAIGQEVKVKGFINLKDVKLVIPLKESDKPNLDKYFLTFIVEMRTRSQGETSIWSFASSDKGIFSTDRKAN